MVVKKDNVITIKLPENGYKLYSQDLYVTQWNKGQKLEILDIADGTEVQFGNDVVDSTINHIVKNGSVDIPDIMLTYSEPIKAYIQVITADSETTEYEILIRVEERTKPSDYIAPEDEQSFREQMEAIMRSTEEIAQSVRDDADNGKFNGLSAYEVAVKNGYTSTEEEWLESLDGKDGKDGIDGTDGYTPVKGTDYFTDEEIEQIEQNAADKVPLDDYVPTSRIIGTTNLSKDVTFDDIGFMVAQAFVTGGSWYSILIPWLISQCGSKSQQDTNTSGIAELQDGMSNYVPITRTIAGINLIDNITENDIAQAIAEPLISNLGCGQLMAEWATRLINNNSAVVANTSARHTHTNKEFLDSLSQDILDGKLNIFVGDGVPSLGLSAYNNYKDPSLYFDTSTKILYRLFSTGTGIIYHKLLDSNIAYDKTQIDRFLIKKADKNDAWTLLHQYALSKDTGIIIDFNTFDFAKKYREIRIEWNSTCSVGNASAWVYFNGSELPDDMCNLATCIATSSCRYDLRIYTEDFYANTLKWTIRIELRRFAAGASATNIYTQIAYAVEKVEDIQSIRIALQSSATIPAGTRISIFGKE